MKNLRYSLEAALVFTLLGIFKCFPAKTASNIGGWLGLKIGPLIGASKRADKHLQAAIPSLSSAEREQIILEMWNHLGRIFAEYPHLKTIAKNYTVIDGIEFIKSLKGPSIAISGHIGNCEVVPVALYTKLGFKLHPMYRAPNNPYVDWLLDRIRTMGGTLLSFAKSRLVIRPVMQAMNDGQSIGILIDQKFNEGVEAPFFGLPAMTSTAFMTLQERYNCPIFTLRCERLSGCNFKITATPLTPPVNLTGAHQILESWIIEKPSQWLWPHRRWRKDALLATKQAVN